jgi:hypothetical protein
MHRFAFSLLLALAGPTAAHAGMLFDMFKTICIDTGADPGLVEKAALAMGAKVGRSFHTDDPFPMAEQFWTIGKNIEIIAGTASVPAIRTAPEESSTHCAVTTYHLPDKASIVRLHRWAGIPSGGNESLGLYSFQDRGGKHVAMPKDRAAFHKAQASGHSWMLSVFDAGDGARVDLTHYLSP